jgi:hypothetical protein
MQSGRRSRDTVVAVARAQGYDLVQRETDTGNLVWTWRSPDGRPQPSFLTRVQAIAFMGEHLGRVSA